MNGEHQKKKIKKIFYAPSAKIYFLDVPGILTGTSADHDPGKGGDSELTDCDWTKNY